jgi:hypothetical protein
MTDWYIDQMKTKTYEADPLPSFTHDQYVGDKLDYVVHIPKTESRWEIKDFMDLLKIQNLQLVCKMDRQFILSNE